MADATLSPEERAAMKEYMAEKRAAAKPSRSKEAKREAERQALLDAIAGMPNDDRVLAEKVHQIVSEEAPDLDPKTWYGMPAWAREGKAVVFFQGKAKFKVRYATLGFNEGAQLDDGTFWPISFAVLEITDAVEARIRGLVRTAASAAPAA